MTAIQQDLPVLPLERSGQLLDILRNTVDRDIDSPNSIIRFFLNRSMSGGWESWLQVEYAQMAVGALGLDDFAREVTYPGTRQRCDLWFQESRGVPIWIELKTQRNQGYVGTVNDFFADVAKIGALTKEFQQTNVLAAAAVFRLSADDRAPLDSFRNSSKRPAGTLFYLGRMQSGRWENLTEEIRTVPPGGLMCVSVVPSVRPPAPPQAVEEGLSR
jgi:hypothetical protein